MRLIGLISLKAELLPTFQNSFKLLSFFTKAFHNNFRAGACPLNFQIYHSCGPIFFFWTNHLCIWQDINLEFFIKFIYDRFLDEIKKVIIKTKLLVKWMENQTIQLYLSFDRLGISDHMNRILYLCIHLSKSDFENGAQRFFRVLIFGSFTALWPFVLTSICSLTLTSEYIFLCSLKKEPSIMLSPWPIFYL